MSHVEQEGIFLGPQPGLWRASPNISWHLIFCDLFSSHVLLWDLTPLPLTRPIRNMPPPHRHAKCHTVLARRGRLWVPKPEWSSLTQKCGSVLDVAVPAAHHSPMCPQTTWGQVLFLISRLKRIVRISNPQCQDGRGLVLCARKEHAPSAAHLWSTLFPL